MLRATLHKARLATLQADCVQALYGMPKIISVLRLRNKKEEFFRDVAYVIIEYILTALHLVC